MSVNRLYVQQNRVMPLAKATAQTAARTTNQALAGDPVVIGQIPGVALSNADANGKVVVQIDGIFSLLVQGVDAGGNSVVAGGDRVYFNPADTPPLSKKVAGIFFGYAFGDAGAQLVALGNTTTAIPVMVQA